MPEVPICNTLWVTCSPFQDVWLLKIQAITCDETACRAQAAV